MAGDKGLSVLVESAGPHSLALDLELPLQSRDGEIGFDIGLPGAPITKLTFAAPPKVGSFTVARREASGTPAIGPEPALKSERLAAERLQPGKEGEPLGTVTHLAVSWEDPGQGNTPKATRSAEADVRVSVGETEIQAEARLRLKGSSKEWRFLAPSTAEVVVGRAPPQGAAVKMLELPPDQGPEEIVRPEPGKSEWLVRFKQANAADLLIVVNAHFPRNRSVDPKVRTLWPVGPYAVLDVARQEGTIRVRSLPHIRAAGVLKGDTQRLDAGDDPNAEAVYHYRSLPAGAKQQLQAPLDLDIRAVTGVVQTAVQHQLLLDAGAWHLQTEISVTPIRADVEALELEVPVSGVFRSLSPKLVEGIVPVRDSGPNRQVVQVKLAAPQRGPFTLVLEGTYPLPLGANEATLVLPRPLGVLDRAGQVSVAVPEGFDLRGGAYQWETDKPGTRIQPLEPALGGDRATHYSASVNRGLSHVELSWRPIHTEFRIETTTDIICGDRRAEAVQQFHATFTDQPQRRLRVHGPATATGVTVKPGSIETTAPGDWTVILPADAGKEASFTLSWSFPQTAPRDEPARMAIPLLWAETATSCESRVRFLRDREASQHLLPTLEPGLWQELPMELLPAGATMLVVRGSGLNLPLSVQMRDAENGGAGLPLVWIDRTLIQAQAADAVQRYRARFHLQKWQARSLDLELPANVGDLDLRVNDQHVDPREAPSEGSSGRVIRVPLPVWRERQKLLIDLKYTLPGAASEGWGGAMTRWQPPRPRGRVAVAAVRWQMALPGRAIPLLLGDAVCEDRWTIRDAYAQPVPAYGTQDLDQWIADGQESKGDGSSGWEMSGAGLTVRPAGLAPLVIMVIPRAAWFMAISLIVLIGGLLVSRLPRRAAGILLAPLGAGAVIAFFIWPQPAGQALMAAQPGLAILALVLALQRFVQWRYRRRLARMPGFSRIHTESALARSNGKRSVRETSAVDTPAAG